MKPSRYIEVPVDDTAVHFPERVYEPRFIWHFGDPGYKTLRGLKIAASNKTRNDSAQYTVYYYKYRGLFAGVIHQE